MEDCKWAKKSCFEGRRDACLNPSVHMTRCNPDDCPSMRMMRKQMEGTKERENDDKVYEGPGTVRVSDNTGTYAVGVEDASTMLEGFFLGAAMQCGDLFDQRYD